MILFVTSLLRLQVHSRRNGAVPGAVAAGDQQHGDLGWVYPTGPLAGPPLVSE